MTPGDIHPTLADVAGYAAAAAMADDPSGVMDAAMAALAAADDRVAVAGAAIAVGDACLRLCASPAASLQDAENKVRFLVIVIGWAWVRAPALAALLEAARRAEHEAWVGDLGVGWTD